MLPLQELVWQHEDPPTHTHTHKHNICEQLSQSSGPYLFTSWGLGQEVPQEGAGAMQDSYLQVVKGVWGQARERVQGVDPCLAHEMVCTASLSPEVQEPSPQSVPTCSAFNTSCRCPGWCRAFCCLLQGGKSAHCGFLEIWGHPGCRVRSGHCPSSSNPRR